MIQEPFIATYIITNRPRGTLYIGVTNHLLRRIGEHREARTPGFARTYGLKRLVWFQTFELMTNAIHREKLMKEWPRQWKINLIERDNPHWDDLWLNLADPPPLVKGGALEALFRRQGLELEADPFTIVIPGFMPGTPASTNAKLADDASPVALPPESRSCR